CLHDHRRKSRGASSYVYAPPGTIGATVASTHLQTANELGLRPTRSRSASDKSVVSPRRSRADWSSGEYTDPTRARSGLAQDALERIVAVPLVPARAGLVAERLRPMGSSRKVRPF